MNLRFTQTLAPERPHHSHTPERMGSRAAVIRSAARRGEIEMEGPAMKGFTPILGARPRGGLSNPKSSLDEASRDRFHGVVRVPKWLDGAFRPRGLSVQGREFLERLDPARESAKAGVGLLDEEPWSSLDQRMAYLRRKYLALDLVRRGLAVEADGRFWPQALAEEAMRAHARGPALRRRHDEAGPLKLQDALAWAGAFREASWDHFRSLHPPYHRATDHLIQAMLDKHLLMAREVAFGKGQLHTLRLTDRGMEFLRRMPEGEGLIARGFGPRKTGRGIGEYHEQAVGDGIGYFAHEVQAGGGRVTGFTLESALRREYAASSHRPDFRIEFETEFGRSSMDIEVAGVGRDYRGSTRLSKMAAVAVRGFDPRGRMDRTRDVGVGR